MYLLWPVGEVEPIHVLEPSLKAWKEYKRLATYLRDAEVRIEVSIDVSPSIHLAKTRAQWKRNIPPIIVSEFICQKEVSSISCMGNDRLAFRILGDRGIESSHHLWRSPYSLMTESAVSDTAVGILLFAA